MTPEQHFMRLGSRLWHRPVAGAMMIPYETVGDHLALYTALD
jgi:hypothetical protein